MTENMKIGSHGCREGKKPGRVWISNKEREKIKSAKALDDDLDKTFNTQKFKFPGRWI